MKDLPKSFVANQIGAFGEAGRAWLDALPGMLAQYERRWNVTIGEPFLLSYNFAAPATRADGTQLVFKAGVPRDECRTEMAALRFCDGDGMVQLIESDDANCAFLMERCIPGTMLTELLPERDDDATAIAAGVMRHLWRPLPEQHIFPSLRRWTNVLERLPEVFGDRPIPFEPKVLQAALHWRADLLASTTETVLLHGDLHHYNILRAQASSTEGNSDGETWRVIDPKGLAGDRAYEISSFLYNPHGFTELPDVEERLARRVDIFVERTGLDWQRVVGWLLVQGIVSSAWTYEDGGVGSTGCERAAQWALNTLG